MTSDAERRSLLRVAREAIAAHVAGRRAPDVSDVPTAARRGGAFVSIHKRGDLRGCIGHLEADGPLAGIVARCAVAACSADPRFPALTADELDAVDLEVSLLGPLEPIALADAIEIGRHGLVVEMGSRRGLLLPQVATEWGWDRETFLAHTCRKAGLPADAWKHGATMWTFEAEVFREHKGHRGNEEQKNEGHKGEPDH